MLYNNFFPSISSYEQNKPLLVFVHGLLGSGDDWEAVLEALADFPRLTIDLPGHGLSADINAEGFESVCHQICDAIKHRLDRDGLTPDFPVVLIGYSLGARLTMYGLTNKHFPGLNLQYAFIEGGNFGLKDQEEKNSRLESDKGWAERFISEPIEQVLDSWYQQPVFASLDSDARKRLIVKRAANHGNGVANMLLSTSLARQPYLLEGIKCIATPLEYICGEKDKKFLQIAAQSALSYTVVEGAGHNVHKECPAEFAQLLRTKLGDIVSPETNESTKLE